MTARHPVLLGLVSAANVLSNIAFQWLLLTMLGPGMQTDALFAAMTVPQLFGTVIAAALTQVLVPLLAGESAEDARRTAWSYIALTGPLFAIVAAAGALTAIWWVPLLVDGFDASGKAEAIGLTQIMVVGIVFTGAIAVQQAAAFARGHYVWPDIAQAVSNLIALVLLWLLLPSHGVVAAAWITLARLALQCLLTINELGRFTRPDLADPGLRQGWARMKPLILGSSYYKLDPVIDRFLLSSLAPGSLSLFYLAQQLYGAASQVLTKALATPALTKMATAVKRGDQGDFARTLRRALFLTILVPVICIAGLALIGVPVLELLLGYGRFQPGHARELWEILLLACVMFVFGASGSLLAGAFYTRGDTRTPTLIGSLSFTIGIGAKVLLFNLMGIRGLAIAVSVLFLISGLGLIAGLLKNRAFAER